VEGPLASTEGTVTVLTEVQACREAKLKTGRANQEKEVDLLDSQWAWEIS
jgi:hypothetical protein